MKMLLIALSMLTIGETILFEFNTEAQLDNWYIVDDVVMGGRSDGDFYVNSNGHGVFEGSVSLENNGGFSSVRYDIRPLRLQQQTKALIRLKGDGKRYQFRVKSSNTDRHSYITHFETTGEWQTIEVDLKAMYPSWRGRRLNMDDYPAERLASISFLISNKKAEDFHLEIDRISLK